MIKKAAIIFVLASFVLLTNEALAGFSRGSGFGEGKLEMEKYPVEFAEMDSDPALPVNNKIQLYSKDNTGTTTLYQQDSAGNVLQILTGSSAAAPSDAQYLTLATNGTLTVERVLTAGTALDFADAGAGSTLTINFDPTEITGGTTWDDGGDASVAWTFDLSGTDPVLTAVSGGFDVTGDFDVSSTIEAGSGNITLTNSTGNIDLTKGIDADLGDITTTSGVFAVEDDSHAHTSSSVSGLDISADTNLAVSGTLLALTDDTLSIREGTLTDEKVCTYESTGTQLDCNESETGTGNIVRATSPTLTTPNIGAATAGGRFTLGENDILLDPALSADGTYSGITEGGTAGATLAFGDLVYLAAADSRWELADADAASTAGDVKLGICVLAAAADGSATTVLLAGKVRADTAFPAFTISAPVYVSTTAGDVQVAQPTGTDDVIRIVGHANTADELSFFPDGSYITHT